MIAGVVDTVDQLIAGVVVTGDKHKVANISTNFRKNSKWPDWYTVYSGAWRKLIHEENLESKISCPTPFKTKIYFASPSIYLLLQQCVHP